MDSRIIAVIASVVLLGAACSSGQAPSPATSAAIGQAARAPSRLAGSASAALAGPAIAGRRTQLSRAAALPDHGEFARYPGDVSRVTGAYTWHRAALSEAHALNAIASGHLRLTTPDGRLLDVVYDRHVEHDSGDWTWIGHLAGHEGVQTVLTIGADAVFGSIGQDIGLPLRLTMRDGLSWLVETDGAKVAEIDSAATRPRRPDFHVPVQPRIAPRGAAAASLPAGRTAAAIRGRSSRCAGRRGRGRRPPASSGWSCPSRSGGAAGPRPDRAVRDRFLPGTRARRRPAAPLPARAGPWGSTRRRGRDRASRGRPDGRGETRRRRGRVDEPEGRRCEPS